MFNRGVIQLPQNIGYPYFLDRQEGVIFGGSTTREGILFMGQFTVDAGKVGPHQKVAVAG